MGKEFACAMMMKQSRDQAISKVLQLRAVPTDSPVTRRFAKAVLNAPYRATIRLGAPQAKFLDRGAGDFEAWILVEEEPQAVFFDPVTGEFGACWGPVAVTGVYLDLGTRSADTLEMFTA